jgi:hypothetical protein
MDAPTLTPWEFRDFLGRSLQGFLDDWTMQNSAHSDACREPMTGQDWLKIFSEFAAAEIVNPLLTKAAALDANAQSPTVHEGRP